jgi:hypothetical protein
LEEEIEQLKKENKSENQKKIAEKEEELKKKRKEYQEKLEKAKKKTTDNIQKQLKKNELNITELDDNRDLKQKILHDPLKFFMVSPLNKGSKLLGFTNIFWLEVIFKLLIIETILIWVSYSETTIV